MSCPHCSGHAAVQATGDTLVRDGRTESTIVLVGNPNVGKSTLFNGLTGARQGVVNAPGTTVEVSVGKCSKVQARVLDMPGTYSLIAQSPDEQTVVDTLAGAPGSFTGPGMNNHVDLVVCLLDGSALTRSLYLLAQVAHTGNPVVGVLTMSDIAAEDGARTDAARLSAVLGIPIADVDPRTSEGIAGAAAVAKEGLKARPRVLGIAPDKNAPGYHEATVIAADDSSHSCRCGGHGCHAPADAASSSETMSDDERAATIFSWISKIEAELGSEEKRNIRPSRSDKIDRVLLNPVAGIPVFLGLMWVLFKIAGEWVGPVMDLFDGLFTSEEPGTISVANGANALLDSLGLADSWAQGLLVGGLVTGLGVVASFFPLMFVIFLMITILEDSGYMARAAFLGDRLMRKIGLDGRVIMPLIMGFGCNLPSLAAVRSLPNARQRLVTVLITPYTSCAARLTIYLMIARIFFPDHTGTVVFGLYMVSIAMVILGALVLKPFLTKDEGKAPLMLVLPAYGMPRVVYTLRSTWARAWSFVKGAGKIIVIMTMVVWLLGATPTSPGYSFADSEMPMAESAYGTVAEALVPVFTPAGFGEWHLTGALMTGFVAKETVISSIVVSYNMDEAAAGDAEDGGNDLGDLPTLVRGSFEEAAGAAAPLGAFAFLLFVLTYTPCLATVAEQARQIGGRRAAAAVVVQLVVAWLLAVGVFQIGRLLL